MQPAAPQRCVIRSTLNPSLHTSPSSYPLLLITYPVFTGCTTSPLPPSAHISDAICQTMNGSFPGGFYDDPLLKNSDQRAGPFDAAVSAGKNQAGYMVGGIGWYRKSFPAAIAPDAQMFIKFVGACVVFCLSPLGDGA